MKRHHRSERRWHGAATVILLLLGVAIALHWGWNGFAVELLSQEAMTFKHALALEVSLLAVASLFPLAWRLFGRWPDKS